MGIEGIPGSLGIPSPKEDEVHLTLILQCPQPIQSPRWFPFERVGMANHVLYWME